MTENIMEEQLFLSNKQKDIQTAHGLFKKAMAISTTSYALTGPSGRVGDSPRLHLYSMLLNRKQETNPEGFATISGITEAVNWIVENAPARTFFTTLAMNFTMLWYDMDVKYKDLCTQIGMAIANKSFQIDPAIRQIAPVPEELESRWLQWQEIRDQCSVNKWVLTYCLFILWADIDELSQNDTAFQRALQNSRAYGLLDKQFGGGTAGNPTSLQPTQT